MLTAAAITAAALALAVQWGLGFRLGQAAGEAAEIAALVLYGIAALLLLAPLGRRRAATAGVIAFMLMLWAVYLNARLSTDLAVQFGGDPAVTGPKLAVVMLFIAPGVALITAGAVYLVARREQIRWTGKTYAT